MDRSGFPRTKSKAGRAVRDNKEHEAMASITERITMDTVGEFRNEPPTDFTNEANRRAQEAALAQVKAELGRTYPIIIGGRRIETAETFKSVNPANPEQVVGVFAKATVDL